LRIYCHFR